MFVPSFAQELNNACVVKDELWRLCSWGTDRTNGQRGIFKKNANSLKPRLPVFLLHPAWRNDPGHYV